ncbi:MAG: YceI family protein [Saprospiraceae bacterium]|nr:YceI family protein [Saprospiraceae bacterium]
MKSLIFAFSMLFISTIVSANVINPSPKSINVSVSNIVWKGYKVTGSHEGNIKFKSGSLNFEGDLLVGGDLTVDMNSMDCTDLSGGGKGKLEGHLKSDDFFGVSNHPTATIKFTKVTSRGTAGDYKITANITIKNITKEVKFNATVKDGMANAAIKLDRSDFDIKYGSGSFFDNLGDKTIYDEFDLVVAIKF